MVSAPRLNSEQCVICKGARLLCGRHVCPLIIKQMATFSIRKTRLTADIEGASPPSFFVGRQNYPQVLVGPMIPVTQNRETRVLDEPDLWYGQSVDNLIAYRASLIRTMFKVNARKTSQHNSRLLDVAQELVMSSKPTLTEATLNKQPMFRIDFDSLTAPLGPTGPLKRITITENPSILPSVDYVVGDTDLKASNAIVNLYQHGLTVTQIQRLLSAGLLGVKNRRLLVPTRWSITVTDDTISKHLIGKVKDFPEIGEYQIFKSNYLDNYFVALLLPRPWLFEQLETWYPGSPWITNQSKHVIIQDHELYGGRNKYARRTAGAYYAARLAVAEYLCSIRRQAGAIIFREVRPGYLFALGVWQIRENLRHAFQQRPIITDTFADALKIVEKSMLTPIKEWIKASKIYDYIANQCLLSEFTKKHLVQSKKEREIF
ncbi:MAG: Nre family DNA repair protein [Candidatus Ranarchaeia archaeon]